MKYLNYILVLVLSLALFTSCGSNQKKDQPSEVFNIEDQYSKGLRQQMAALEDGFIMSVDQEFVTDAFFFILGIAVIDGEIWVWDIDSDEPYQPIGWGKVNRNP